MKLIEQKLVYLPLVININYIIMKTGNNVAFEFKNKEEHDYIATTVRSQLNVDTSAYNKDNIKEGIIILPFNKDEKVSHTVEVINFDTFKYMCTNYITNTKTDSMDAIEYNFNNHYNKFKQLLIDLFIMFSTIFTLSLIFLDVSSSRINSNNELVALFIVILIYFALIFLLNKSSKSEYFYSNGYSPPRYQRVPYQWIIIYLLFDLAVALISLIDFHANFTLLLQWQFYQTKWQMYLCGLLIAWSSLPHRINL